VDDEKFDNRETKGDASTKEPGELALELVTDLAGRIEFLERSNENMAELFDAWQKEVIKQSKELTKTASEVLGIRSYIRQYVEPRIPQSYNCDCGTRLNPKQAKCHICGKEQ
jgi:hypothetical protein